MNKNCLMIVLLTLTLGLFGCNGGGNSDSTAPEGGGGTNPSTNTCTDENASNFGDDLPCSCPSGYTVSVDTTSCESTSSGSTYSGWVGYDDSLTVIDETDIDTSAPAGGLDTEENYILVSNKILIGEVASNQLGAVIKDPSCGNSSTAVKYTAILLETTDNDVDASAITLYVGATAVEVKEVGVSYNEGVALSGSTYTYDVVDAPSGGSCSNGIISYTGGKALAHNGDYVIYHSGTGVYVGVKTTVGTSSSSYTGKVYTGLTTVSGDWRDSNRTTDGSGNSTFAASGWNSSVDAYIARVNDDLHGILFNRQSGTSGVNTKHSAVSIIFNGGNYSISVQPSDSVIEGSGVVPLGQSKFHFGTLQ